MVPFTTSGTCRRTCSALVCQRLSLIFHDDIPGYRSLISLSYQSSVSSYRFLNSTHYHHPYPFSPTSPRSLTHSLTHSLFLARNIIVYGASKMASRRSLNLLRSSFASDPPSSSSKTRACQGSSSSALGTVVDLLRTDDPDE